ncbi:MAG: hypothetical protein GXP63_05710 [DPANN group archaeon]|nr:hypothetical protein [DPANN group archaeon]
MKHTPWITLFLILAFFAAQLMGLLIISQYVNIEASSASGMTVLHEEQYFIEPPRVEDESFSFIFIMLLVLFGTAIILLLVKFKRRRFWKLWFLLSVVISLSLGFFPFIRKALTSIAPGISNDALTITFVIALFLGLWKVFRPNVWVHNFTELFIYGGIAALLVPIINVFSAFFLLLSISLYDIFAVNKSKHMVRMAEFQTESKVFAGLFMPYGRQQTKIARRPAANVPLPQARRLMTKKDKAGNAPSGATAVLGGGDIAFPLLFTGALLKTTGSFFAAFIVVITATIGLSWLLLTAKKGKFYPAMPAISIGCVAGYLFTLLL